MNKVNAGNEANIDPAEYAPKLMCFGSALINVSRPIANVFSLFSIKTNLGKITSVNGVRNDHNATIIKAGLITGNKILKNNPQFVHPSIFPESSSSGETVSK
ncbi:Uncharacterised protein [Mycoplasmopsis edwardii]|uniref:Uncharacterized protein n=1 Tax=Mycoplasmopsis edwardii TaxID=53558 RepID=A0A3B0PHL0_9BACT|nr:Uncharacterised protein [Mycoplasmopsis edwardii]